MICSYCNTPNDPSNQFCVNCGRPLSTIESAPQQNSLRRYMGLVTSRLVISLFGLWILNRVLDGLQFAKDLRIPEVPIPTTSLIDMIIAIIIIVLLINYINMLGSNWPRAFSKFRDAVSGFEAIAYLIILSATYKIGLPLLGLIEDPADVILAFQAILLTIALIISIRACVIIYQALPSWLVNIRFQAPVELVPNQDKQ